MKLGRIVRACPFFGLGMPFCHVSLFQWIHHPFMPMPMPRCFEDGGGWGHLATAVAHQGTGWEAV